MDRPFFESKLKKWGLWGFDTLEQVKQALKFNTSNPKGEVIWEKIQSPEDCFGRYYSGEAEECNGCTVQVSIDCLICQLRLACAATMCLIRLKSEDMIQPVMCACGCGKPVRRGRKFLRGHFWKGKHFADIHKQRLSLAQPNRKVIG